MLSRNTGPVAALLVGALLLMAGLAFAEEPALIGQASYVTAAGVEDFEETMREGGYDGDIEALLFVQSFDGRTNHWVVVPESADAKDFLGKGVRYTVDRTIREAAEDRFAIVAAKTLDAIAESVKGTLVAMTDDEIVVDVAYGSDGWDDEAEARTMRFAITQDTERITPLALGEVLDVLYDDQMRALYVFHTNG